MNTNNLDVNNQQLFDFSRFSGLAGTKIGKFSNIGGTNLSGIWNDSAGSSITIKDDGVEPTITFYYSPTNIPLKFLSENSFSAHFNPEPFDRYGLLTDNNTRIHWTKNGNDDGIWNKVSDAVQSTANPNQGIGNTVQVPVTPITPPGTPTNTAQNNQNTGAGAGSFNDTILAFQVWANQTKGLRLPENGIADKATADAFNLYKSEYNLYLQKQNTHTTIWGMPAWVVYTGGTILALGTIFAIWKWGMPAMQKAKAGKAAAKVVPA